jgi:hypothetical protein
MEGPIRSVCGVVKTIWNIRKRESYIIDFDLMMRIPVDEKFKLCDIPDVADIINIAKGDVNAYLEEGIITIFVPIKSRTPIILAPESEVFKIKKVLEMVDELMNRTARYT